VTIKNKLKVLVDEKGTYSVEYFEGTGKNRYHIRLYHTKYGYTSHDIELLSKIDDDPVVLRIDHRLYKLQLEKISKNDYRVKSREWTQTHLVKILELIPKIQTMDKYPIHEQMDKEPIRERIIVEKNAVTAPMAGLISSVKIKEGESVKVGDMLLTLNAMKMENEICAAKTGKVRKILVKEGSQVGEGDPLVIID